LASALLGSCSAGKFDVKMPDFSWDTLPVGYHGANYDVFSNESIQRLAKFPVVTLEKCQGWHSLNPPCTGYSCLTCCEEDVYRTVGAQIKAINPRTKVVAYLHSNKVMPWYNLREEMNTTDACYNGDDMNETQCVAAGTNEVFFDFRKPTALKMYNDACTDMTKTGAVDACFSDGCVKLEAPVGKAVRNEFLAAKLANLKKLQEVVPGPMICGSGGGLNPDMAAMQVQAFSAKHAGWWGNMMHMNKSASQEYMFEAHGHELCYNSDVTSTAFQTEYAAFLMFAQKWTYHICGSWCGSDPVWPKVFDMPLGAPVNNATSADGIVWSRKFASGTQVFFNKTSTVGWVEWGRAAKQFIDENYMSREQHSFNV